MKNTVTLEAAIPPLCVNCKHYDDGCIGEDYLYQEKCRRPTFSMVFGTVDSCLNPEIERTTGNCGPAALFYIQIEKTKSISERILAWFSKKV